MTLSAIFVRAARAALLATGLAVSLAAWPVRAASPVNPAQPSGRWRDASLDDYRSHLTALSMLVQACAKSRDLKTCDPLLVGPDDRLPLGAGPERRLVRYGWLRVLLSQAEEPDEPDARLASRPLASPQSHSDQPAPIPTSQLLQAAVTRLALDLAQANDLAAARPPAFARERDTMRQVLAGSDFRGLQQTTVRNSMLEKFNNWLNRLFEGASRLRARSAWVGRLIVWGFILSVCVGLVWGLLQLERRWRIRLVPEEDLPAPGAASARDWQLWLEDARRAAAAGQWREAIHSVYWASISRLESRRLWPADRARTPREYLALIAPVDPRRPGLAQLTSTFEHTWYGGRPAAEPDYRLAEELATALIAGGSAAAQGGVQ